MKDIDKQLISFCAIAIACCILLKNCADKAPASSGVQIRDSVVVKYVEKIRIDTVPGKTKWRTLYRYDTLTKEYHIIDTQFVTKPFETTLDTIVRHDTVHLQFLYPEKSFSMLIKPHPDSILIRTITITPPPEKPSFWDDLGKIGGGFLGGYIVGKLTK